MISFSNLSKRRGATLAGVFSVALSCVVLLCGAGSAPIENLLPQGAMQGDLNAGGHSLTNAGTVSATNVVVSGSLTAPSSFTLPFSGLTSTPTTLAGYGITDPIVLSSGSYSNPAWVTSLAYSKLTGAPTIPPALTLTTTGTSGAATYNSGTGALNVPVYAGTTYSAGSGLTLTGTTFSVTPSTYAPWAGSNSITTLGTISSGTWNGTAIGNAYLANSALTLNTHSVSLGGSLSLTYTDVGADASGAAATAQSNAETFSANAGNITSGTLAAARVATLNQNTSGYAGSVGTATYTTSPSTPVANVKAYGAKGDGSTDDTTAVNSALAACSRVYFPPGTYLVSNLTVNNNNVLSGDGPASIIEMKSGATGYVIYGNGFGYSVDYLAFLGQNNSSFQSNSSSGSQSCLHFDTTYTGQRVDHVSIAGFNNIAVGANGNPSTAIPGMVINDCTLLNDWCGIDTGPGGTGQTTALGGVNGSEYMVGKGNTIQGAYYALVIDSGNTLFEANDILNNGTGLYVNTASNGAHGAFIGNLVNHNTAAITIAGIGTQDYLIENNWILLNTNGIKITNSSVRFDDNYITGSQYPINISQNSANYQVQFTNNKFYNGTPPVVYNDPPDIYSAASLNWQNNTIATPSSGVTPYVNNLASLQVDNQISYAKAWVTGSQVTVANASFATTGNWTNYVSGWTIAGNGYAASSSANGVIYQGLSGITQYNYYAITYTISSYSSGCVNAGIGFASGGFAPPHNANGTYTDVVQVLESGSNLVFYSGAFNGHISGVTVYAVTQAPGTLNLGTVNLAAPQTTVSGSTSGSAVFSEPFAGTSFKKVVIHTAGLTGTASYTYPTAFTTTPIVVNSDAAATSVSTTAVTVTGSSTTDTLILEGY
jgi:hypothetical protein